MKPTLVLQPSRCTAVRDTKRRHSPYGVEENRVPGGRLAAHGTPKQENEIGMQGKRYRDFDDDDLDRGEWGEAQSSDAEDPEEESLDDILASARELTDDSTEISMEVDDNGNEVWHAEDPKIPGSSSLGNSLEEAMEGMEDRRREFRELLSRSREGDGDRTAKPDISAADLDRARTQYREKLKRSRKRKRS